MARATMLVLAGLVAAARAQITVVCIGDSNTVGKRAVSGNDYPAVLGRLLGSGFEVHNQGRGGSTATEDTDRPYTDEDEYDDAKKLVERAEGTVVVLSVFGTNDAKADQWDDVKGDFVDEYKALLEDFMGFNDDVHVAIGIPVPYLGNDLDWTDEYEDMWDDIDECPINNDIPDKVREIASDLGIVVFDLQQAFIDEFGMSDVNDFGSIEKYYADRVHPLDEALAVVAEAAYGAVMSLGLGYAPTYRPTYEPTRSPAPTIELNPSPKPTRAPSTATAYPVPLSTIRSDPLCPALTELNENLCPTETEDLDINNCATPGLLPGDLCEGDGECGTDKMLDNCEAADMYVVAIAADVEPTAAPTMARVAGCPVLKPLPASECPASRQDLDIGDCLTEGLALGDLCEGDGECGTSQYLDNCMTGDMYVVVAASEVSVEVVQIHLTEDDDAASAATARRRLEDGELSDFCVEFMADYYALPLAQFATFVLTTFAGCGEDMEEPYIETYCVDDTITHAVNIDCDFDVATVAADVRAFAADGDAQAEFLAETNSTVNASDVAAARQVMADFVLKYPIIAMDVHAIDLTSSSNNKKKTVHDIGPAGLAAILVVVLAFVALLLLLSVKMQHDHEHRQPIKALAHKLNAEVHVIEKRLSFKAHGLMHLGLDGGDEDKVALLNKELAESHARVAALETELQAAQAQLEGSKSLTPIAAASIEEGDIAAPPLGWGCGVASP